MQSIDTQAEYRSIFDATTDGLAIVDLEGNIVEANPAYCRMVGYSYEELIGMPATAIMHRDYHHLLAEGLQSIKEDGRAVQANSVLVRKDGSLLPVEGRGTAFTYKGRPHILGVARDISDRLQAEEQLREREEQYRSIFEVSSDAFAITDLETGLVIDANPAMCRMHGYTYDEIVGLHPTEFVHPDYHEAFRRHSETVKGGGSYRARSVDLRKDGTPFHVEVHGTTFTYKGKPRRLAVLRDITEQVQAFELLEQRVEERTRELSILLDVAHTVGSTLELDRLLDLILDRLNEVVDYTGAGIAAQDGDVVRIIGYRGPGPRGQGLPADVPLSSVVELWDLMGRAEPVIIDDVRGDTPDAHTYLRAVGDALETSFDFVRSWMTVPMRVKDQFVGALFLEHSAPKMYSKHHADLALAIADQAAVAIENARLYRRSQEAAALEERQRLARELHDSVSQALFGIGLGARTARAQLERDVEQAAQSIDYVLSLTQGGMAEMRALIFELRPESLETEGLVQALTKQADAVRARYEILISPTLCDEPAVPLSVKEALYRIAQEALHNAVKHAQPRSVTVSLEQNEREVVLEIRDDGHGFDPQGSFPGHLGLHSMRERAERVGGTLVVESRIGEGTRVRVRVPTRSDG